MKSNVVPAAAGERKRGPAVPPGPEVSAKAKLLTPAQVHFGDAPEVIRQRQDVLAAAYAARPERFVAGPPRASELPAQVWINPPLPVSAVDGEDRTADGEGDDGKEGPLH